MDNEYYIKYIESNLYKVSAFIAGIVFILVLSASIDSWLEKLIINTQIRFSIYGATLLIWTCFWLFYKYRLPRNKKGKVGIVVAIHAETNNEEIRLKNDFISKLKENINKEKCGEVINIIVLKNHFSEKLDDIGKGLRLHKNIKGHFYVYGQVKRRSDGEKKYFLKLEGLVAHRPINIRTQDFLKKEFVSILPKQISFFETFEFKGFEFTADIVYLAARYITGIAAYLSGDPILAHEFHSNLQGEFNKFQPLPPHLQVIKNKIPALLSDEELIIARHYYFRNEAGNLKEWLDKSLKSNPNNYGGWVLKAIVDFLPTLDNNPDTALESIKRARRYASATHEWRYSRAFLYFWVENYIEALRDCENLKNKSYHSEDITIKEVEDFNLQLLKENPGKIQLYFWLGYINLIKKRNLPLAYKYFSKFEEKADQTMDLLKQKSNVYLSQIKSEMKLK
ncbi:MAG TPA: hypothetical protein ENH86_00390 [Candidatus Jorgensenbacteria bacterium]|nr:hypothetical protein [Candidatus Jorgensenbacteria bacterium]